MDLSLCRARSALNRLLRSFFSERGFTEVQTPVLTPGVIPESPIELFETVFIGAAAGERPLYLLPSPELHMKKLIAGGSGSIFQLQRCFRNGEESGRLHNPEFTMLEWYETEADYGDSIRTAEALFSELAGAVEAGAFADTSDGGHRSGAGAESEAPGPARAQMLTPPFRTMSVREALLRYSGVDLLECGTRARLAGAVQRAGLSAEDPGESWEQLFNRLMVTFVEPGLPHSPPTILYDYPAQVPALAKSSTDGPWLERWELYAAGVELANCYSEETDPAKLRSFFEREYAAKAASSRVVPDVDDQFLRMFESATLPDCSGTALGTDRLLMLITGADSLEGVILFPFSDILHR